MDMIVKERDKRFAYIIEGKTREELERRASEIDYQYYRIENHGDVLVEIHKESAR